MSTSTTRSRRPLQLLLACFAALGLLFASGCSSDSDSTSNGADTTLDIGALGDNSDLDDDGGSGGGGNTALPEGLPDVPLPEYSDVQVIMAGTEDAPGWNFNLTVDGGGDLDAFMDAYAAQLEADGYSLDRRESGGNHATKGQWVISFHSTAENTLSMAVTESLG